VLALAGAMALPALVTLSYVWRRAVALADASDPAGRVARPESAHPLRPSWGDVLPIGAGIVFSALYFRVDILVLQAWSGTSAVGLYNAVFRLVEALRLLPAAVLAVAMPVLFRAGTTRPLRRLSGALAGGATILAAALMAGADWLIPFLYGPVFADAVPAFRILLGAFPLMAVNYALTHQLIGWNYHRGYAAICLAALVFNLALNIRLIPAMSIAGAAWATLWTEVVLTAGCVLLLSRQRLATHAQPSAAAAR
jgi:O-antigen/teichoic acid export membrane protein